MIMIRKKIKMSGTVMTLNIGTGGPKLRVYMYTIVDLKSTLGPAMPAI